MMFERAEGMPCPDHAPVVVLTKSGMLVFGRKLADRLMAHVPFEDTHRDFGPWDNVSHYLIVERPADPPAESETFEAEAAPDPNGPDTVYS